MTTPHPTPAGTPFEWTVSGMDCGSCAAKIRDAVGRLPGVGGVEVAVMSERLKLTLDESRTGRATVEATVRALGFGIGPRRGGLVVLDGPPVLRRGGDDHEGHQHAASCCGGAAAGSCCAGDAPGHDHGGPPAARADATPDHAHGSPAREARWWQSAKGRLVIGTGLLLILAYAARLLLPGDIGRWAFVPACAIGVAPVARRALAALRLGQPFTIEALMTVAALGALFIGAAEEGAVVVFLFAVGEVLEGVAANRARASIRALTSLVPRTALLDENGRLREVSAAALRPGQIVLVRPGDRVSADGLIAEGTSGLDESPVTGESVPVTRGPGEAVFAGSINTEAALRIRVTRSAEDTTIARIIRLVEEAEEARAPTERFIDRFSRWYMPAIVALAVLVMVVPPLGLGLPWQTWIYRGLALLLIGCPCALVISVPAAIASALSTGARRGLLMKGGAVIEAAAGVRRVAFDKTGTLTHGRPEVTDVIPLGAETAPSVLAVAAAVEAGSSHPLARAIVARAAALDIVAPPAREARAIPGLGVEALVGEHRVWVASPRHAAAQGALDDRAIESADRLESQGKTVAAVFRAGQGLGLIALRDEPRAEAAEAVRQLQDLGLSTVILTGDNPRTAAAIAAALGMEVRAGMLPEDKLREIGAMAASGGVMMVGDGINDAPALKRASVGVAMGSGTDVALETADAALLRDRVTDVAATIRLARATMANIRQNVALALGLKGLFLVTTVLGVTGLWIAVLADTGATVLVTLNALRLLRFDPGRTA